MTARRAAGAAVVVIVALGAALAGSLGARAARADDRTAAGKAGFLTLYKVLQHPRCMNCHPSGDAPLSYDDARPHGMAISRRSEANGVACATCHRDRNGARPGQPPGAPSWHLPPADTPMIFQGRTPHQLCLQLLGKKDVDAVQAAPEQGGVGRGAAGHLLGDGGCEGEEARQAGILAARVALAGLADAVEKAPDRMLERIEHRVLGEAQAQRRDLHARDHGAKGARQR